MKGTQHKDSFCITGSGIKCCLQGRAHIAMVTCSNPSQWVFLGEEDDTGGRASTVPVHGVIPAISKLAASPALQGVQPATCAQSPACSAGGSCWGTAPLPPAPPESQCCRTPRSPPVTGSLWMQCTLAPHSFWPHTGGSTDHDIINHSLEWPNPSCSSQGHQSQGDTVLT